MNSIWYVLSLLRVPVHWVFPFLSDLRDWERRGRIIWWLVHGLIVAAIVVALYFIQHAIPSIATTFHQILRQHTLGLERYFLPLLFLTLYAFGWMFRWLWFLLFAEAATSPFPDIDAAWSEINLVLRQLGMQWTDAPVYLILGRPAEGEEALLQATGIPFRARAIPRNPDAPVRVYANRDGIYLTCTGSSLLGKHTALLAGEGEPGTGLGLDVDRDPEHPGATIGLPGVAKNDPSVQVAREIMGRARAAGREGRFTEEEKELLKRAQRVRFGSMVENRDLMQWLTARLTYLCQLLAGERSPYVPINGIVLVVPFHATETAADTHDTGLICQRELAVVRETLKCQCPVLALVADLEGLIGFDELIRRFEPEDLKRRVGQRLPLVPDLPREKIPTTAAAAVHWICAVLVPSWIIRLLSPITPGAINDEVALQANTRLFRLMFLIRQRQLRLGEIIRRALDQEKEPVWFAGCYLAGTGREPARQAFVPGLFQRLGQEQDKVSWTEEALVEDGAFLFWGRLGYVAIVFLWLGIAGMMWWAFTAER